MNNTALIKYPLAKVPTVLNTEKPRYIWEIAANHIVEDVKENGYIGQEFKHSTLEHLFDMTPPAIGVKNQFSEYAFKYLNAIEGLKDNLLKEHQICLESVRGYGYRVMHPNEQVSDGVKKHFKKAGQCLTRGLEVATHVKTAELDRQGQIERSLNISKMQFIHKAMKRKRISHRRVSE